MEEGFAKTLTPAEKANHDIGHPFPSRADGLTMKAPRKATIYIVLNGKRHNIPNMDTFNALKLKIEDVKIVSEYDLEHIPLGDPIKDINSVSQARLLTGEYNWTKGPTDSMWRYYYYWFCEPARKCYSGPSRHKKGVGVEIQQVLIVSQDGAVQYYLRECSGKFCTAYKLSVTKVND